jgi:hypothetical protein
MSPTLSSLFAASLLLGQTGPVQIVGPLETSGGTYSGGTVQQQLTVNPPNASPPRRGFFSSWREERPILTKMQSWFGRRDNPSGPNTGSPGNGGVIVEPAEVTPYITAPAAAPAAEFPRRMPTTGRGTPVSAPQTLTQPFVASSVPVSAVTYENVAPPAPNSILPALANKVGRDEKFAWITGQLGIENGVYVLYYATPETVDPYHGKLVLQTQADMKALRRGDLVTAQGQVQSHLGLRSGTPTYRADSVTLVERSPR